MGKSDLTIQIENILFKRLGRKEFGCKEVTIGWYGREIVDFITYSIDKDREIRCFEIKVTKADYCSNNAITFIGNRNYFVMPEELYEELRMDIYKNYKNVGVYVLRGNELVVAVNARRVELKADKEVILSSMARSMQREWFKQINYCEILNIKMSDNDEKIKLLKDRLYQEGIK